MYLKTEWSFIGKVRPIIPIRLLVGCYWQPTVDSLVPGPAAAKTVKFNVHQELLDNK